jgi:hypothetical protein
MIARRTSNDKQTRFIICMLFIFPLVWREFLSRTCDLSALRHGPCRRARILPTTTYEKNDSILAIMAQPRNCRIFHFPESGAETAETANVIHAPTPAIGKNARSGLILGGIRC